MPRYFDDWEPGAFPAQRALCAVLEDTDYALEEPDLNPLTLRLTIASEAANALDACIQGASAGLPRLWQEAAALWRNAARTEDIAFSEEPYVSLTGVMATIPVIVSPDGRGGQRVHTPADPNAFTFPILQAQQHLYHFFTGYCDAFDRVAQEVENLFQVRTNRHGWRELTGWKHGRNRALNQIRDHEPAFTGWVSGFYADRAEQAFQYRDTLREVGHIPARAAVDGASRRWQLLVGAVSEDKPIELNTDAVQLCRVLMRDGLVVINTVYHILFKHCQSHGLPPW